MLCYDPKKIIPCNNEKYKLQNTNWIADNYEHVPLLVSPTHHKQNNSNLVKNNKVTNGNGLIDNNSEQHQIRQSQISPASLSSNTTAHVMRARLNQYRTNNVIVNFNENGTDTKTSITMMAEMGKSAKNRKKKFAAEI
jgi:hypothetical protein